ncbi:MAG TPA: hypothetical protein VHY33_14845 [Thermoanaerobaculia bacterium]|nr:hypothetical protein [Thermoanaerobaculia bacterium]
MSIASPFAAAQFSRWWCQSCRSVENTFGDELDLSAHGFRNDIEMPAHDASCLIESQLDRLREFSKLPPSLGVSFFVPSLRVFEFLPRLGVSFFVPSLRVFELLPRLGMSLFVPSL